MFRPSILFLFFVSALLLHRSTAVPISSRDRNLIQTEILEDLLEKVAEEIQVRAIEREIIEGNIETDELPQISSISSSPTKRDSNEKRNLSRLAQMGARGFGRRRR